MHHVTVGTYWGNRFLDLDLGLRLGLGLSLGLGGRSESDGEGERGPKSPTFRDEYRFTEVREYHPLPG